MPTRYGKIKGFTFKYELKLRNIILLKLYLSLLDNVYIDLKSVHIIILLANFTFIDYYKQKYYVAKAKD